MLGIWGTRRVVLFLAAMGVALLIASGLAVAATLNGTSGDDNIVGTEDIRHDQWLWRKRHGSGQGRQRLDRRRSGR